MGEHMAAEVQDGLVQQLFLDKVEDVEHATIAVGERVDGFELVVAHTAMRIDGSRSVWLCRKRSQLASMSRRRASPSGGV